MRLAPVILEGSVIRLEPLTAGHHAALCEIGLDPDLWKFTTIRVQTAGEMKTYIETALRAQENGTALPFVIVERATSRIIGTTRFHSATPADRRVEIGFTWIAPQWQRTTVNTEAKYLMLRHAFEKLNCIRVEFRADAENERSRRALRRIGATEECIFRSYRVTPHKGVRDLVVFSVIASEWPEIKTSLETALARRG